MESGVLPRHIKLVIFVYIFKKDNKNSLGNYRPILMLFTLSKIKKNIYLFLMQINILLLVNVIWG